jgi:hypothetical protein
LPPSFHLPFSPPPLRRSLYHLSTINSADGCNPPMPPIVHVSPCVPVVHLLCMFTRFPRSWGEPGRTNHAGRQTLNPEPY